MSPAQAKGHKAILEASSAELEGGTLNAIGVLAEITRMRQFATCAGRIAGDGVTFEPQLPSNKLDYLVDLLDQLGIPDEPTTKLVVVSQFTSVLELFAGHFQETISGQKGRNYSTPRTRTALLTGNVTGAKRQQVIEDFNQPAGTDSAHVLLSLIHI